MEVTRFKLKPLRNDEIFEPLVELPFLIVPTFISNNHDLRVSKKRPTAILVFTGSKSKLFTNVILSKFD